MTSNDKRLDVALQIMRQIIDVIGHQNTDVHLHDSGEISVDLGNIETKTGRAAERYLATTFGDDRRIVVCMGS